MRIVVATLLTASVAAAGVHLTGPAAPAAASDRASTPAVAAATPAVDTWGDNSAGELGNGTLTPSSVPVPVNLPSGGSPVTAVAAGGRHDLALLADGTVLAWGDDTAGQLGNGVASANDDSEAPAVVPGLSGVTAVAAGGEHSLALLSDGTVEAWGANNDGQLGDGTDNPSATPIPVPGLTGVKAISAGDQFSLALLRDGTVEAWGDGADGQLGDGSLANRDVPVVVSKLKGVSAVSAGGRHALALLAGGTAMAWGDNEEDQLGDGEDKSDLKATPVAVFGLKRAVAVAAGTQHSVALLKDGTVMAWGDNGFYQLAQPQGFPSGRSRSDKPLKVPGISGATAIAAGGLFSVARLGDGDVVGWGDNAFGQLGNGSDATDQPVVEVPGLTGVTAIAAGGATTLAVVSPSGSVNGGLGEAAGPLSSPWRVVPTQDPSGDQPTDLPLTAVSASSPTDAWAVASFPGVTTEPTGEHWDGQAWTIQPFAAAPGPPGSLHGVDDVSATDVWAVGSFGGVGDVRTLIEHFDGTSWSVVPSPDPETGPGAIDELQAVGGTDPNDLWAVGTYSDGQRFNALLLLHWDGTSWTFFPPPVLGEQFGEAVTVLSAHDVWVVGDQDGGTVSAHFNGKAWKEVATPYISTAGTTANQLTGVANAGPNDLWVSGYALDDGANTRTPYVLHWDGEAWSLETVPTAGSEGSLLTGVAVLSAGDVWLSGASFNTDGASTALSEQFDGTTWSIVPGLDPGQLSSLPSNDFAAIAPAGSGTLLTVGSQETPSRCCLMPLAEQTTNG